MNILQICNKSPVPPKEGGPIAMYHLAHALIENDCSVTVFAAHTPKYKPDKESIEKYLSDNYTYYSSNIDTSIKISDALNSFVNNRSYHVERFISENFKNDLIKILKSKSFDVVIFETLYMTPYLSIVRKYSKAKCILRSHNIEHQIWERITNNTKNPVKKLYLKQLTYALKKYEKKMLEKYDAIACISPEEINYYFNFIKKTPVACVPFGIKKYAFNKKNAHNYQTNDFYTIGSMDWMPNQEGIKWFLDKVVPIIKTEHPEFKIHIAGRNIPLWIYKYADENIQVVGEVDNVYEFAENKRGIIVPLFSGSGIRIKIIEAMAMGKIVISTSVGAEGIHFEHSKNILIANNETEFVKAIKFCYENKLIASEIALAGKRLVENQHNYHNVNNSFQNLISACL